MTPAQYVVDSSSFCPCTPWLYSKYCKHGFAYFKEYVNTENAAKRKAWLIQFKQEQAEWRKSARI